jgi:arylsulfatase
MGLIDSTTTPLLDVMGSNGAWDKLSAAEKEKQAMKMATHAAMVERLDLGVGEIIKTLEQTNTLQNTLILFLADNGASPEIPGVPGYDRPSQTRDGRELQYDKVVTPDVIGSEISYTGIGSNWANALNTPFRFWKMESFEGGVHTPMIIHWPAGLKVKKGSLNPALGHVTDILPTLLDINKFRYPVVYNGNALTPLDGQSLLPVMQGKTNKGRKDIFFEHVHGKAYINGNWKLVMKTNGSEWELYDLSKDANEHNNLATSNPDKLNEMKTAWENWYNSMKPYIHLRPGSGPR